MKPRSITGIAALCAVLIVTSSGNAFSQTVSGSSAPARIVLGGKAVAMVADMVYAFPQVRDKVIAVAGTDQGLVTFLETVSPGFSLKPMLDKQAGPEAYAALKPDLVILEASMKGSLGKGLEALGIAPLYLKLETPEDYFDNLVALGRALGQEKRAEELIAYYRTISDGLDAVSSASAYKPSVLVVQATADGLEVPPDSWMQTQLVLRAGGRPVWSGSNPGSGWARVNPEQLAAWNPEYLIVISYRNAIDKTVADLKADPRYSNLAAVKNGRTYGFPQDYYSWDQPDTRWGLGLLWLNGRLNADSGININMDAHARLFFKLFYNMNDAAFDKIIKPKLSGDWR